MTILLLTCLNLSWKPSELTVTHLVKSIERMYYLHLDFKRRNRDFDFLYILYSQGNISSTLHKWNKRVILRFFKIIV